MATPSHLGGCRCGQVRYSVAGEVRDRFLCHCESCRRFAGASPVPWVTFDASGFEVLQGELIVYASSPDVRRAFCATCGTALTYRHASTPVEVDVTTLSLDEPSQCAPLYHIWVSDQLPWIAIGDDLPRYDTTRDA